MVPDTSNTERSNVLSLSRFSESKMDFCDFNDPKKIIEHFKEYRCLLGPILERSDNDQEAARIMRDELGLKERMCIKEVAIMREKLGFISAINSRKHRKDSNYVVQGYRYAM